MLLALDTSGAVSVATWDEGRLCREWAVYDPRRHAELLAPAVREAVNGQVVSEIVVGVGPGPFTGLRVAPVTAVMLGEVWGVQLVGVCSLDGLALQAASHPARRAGRPLVVASDARRREVYWAVYDAVGHRVAGPGVGAPAAVPVPEGADVVGRGVVQYPLLGDGDDVVVLAPVGDVEVGADVSAAWVDPVAAGLAERVAWARQTYGDDWPGEPVQPVYLRRPDAAVPTGAGPVTAVVPDAGQGRL